MENKAHAFAAGIFVVTVAAILLGLAFWLSRDTRVRDVYELSTKDAVTGLSEQAAVRFRGITVGKVTHIGFDPMIKGNVLVRIDVDTNLPLTKTAFSTLGYQGVTGLAYVQLDNDGPSDEALSTSADEPTRIPFRPGFLSQFADQGSFLLEQAQRVSESVGELLSPANQQAIMGSVQSIGDSANKLGAASERIQAIMDAQFGPERTDIPALVADTRNTMKALQKTSAELNATAMATTDTAKALTRVGQQISVDGGMLDQLGQSAAALNQSVQTINAALLPSTLRAADGASRTANSATRAARGIDRAMGTIADNPQSLLYGSGSPAPGPGEPGFVAPQPVSP
jgi:phospholipid/cholesterol/gamma-HCH transport system substrate-binding protein